MTAVRTHLGRQGLRVAHAGLVVVSHVVRPHTRGVKLLLAHGEDELLLVRHSYGARDWDVPGGFCRRGEAFADAARRELREELATAATEWTDLGELHRRTHGRHETIGCVRARLIDREVRPDEREVVAARWFPRAALPPNRAEIVDGLLALEQGAAARLSASGHG